MDAAGAGVNCARTATSATVATSTYVAAWWAICRTD